MGIYDPSHACMVTATPFVGGPGGVLNLIARAPAPVGASQVPGACLLSARWYVNLYLPSALLLVSELSKSVPNTFGHVHPISIYHSVLEAMKLALVFLAHLITVLSPDFGAIR